MAQAHSKTTKRAAAKKPAVKKATSKKAAEKKATEKKPAAKQAPAEKATKAAVEKKAQKPAAKKATTKKPAAKKEAAAKPAAKKPTTTKAAAKKESAQAAPKKAAAKPKAASAKKEAAKKPATKKASAAQEAAPTAKKPATKAKAKAETKAATKPAAKAKAPEPQAAPKPKASEVKALAEDLAGAARRRRQDASHELGLIAHSHPEALKAVLPELIDALERPEAQTRWEVLLALAELAPRYADQEESAFPGAEDSLFDEGSATVRLAAFGFLATYGATAPKRSEAAWPLLDEAIQCYHGDSEYRDMLGYLLTFAKGDIAGPVRTALAERVRFDATSGRGYVQACSAEIIEAAAAKK